MSSSAASSSVSPVSVLVRPVLLVLAGTALLTLSAYVQVPFWPVKMSMQTAVVLALGVAYGGRLACATVLAYIAEGALGLPVFVSGGGWAMLAGPTGGYLVGFALAAFVVGTLAERGAMRTLGGRLGVLLLGEAIMFALGVGYLATLIGIDKALTAGLLVFLPGEALKVALVAALTPVLRRPGQAS